MSNIPQPKPMTEAEVNALTCPINPSMTKEQAYEALRTWEMLELGISTTIHHINTVWIPVMDFIIENRDVVDIMEESAGHDILARMFIAPEINQRDLWTQCPITDKHIAWFKEEIQAATNQNGDYDVGDIVSAIGVFTDIETITNLYEKGVFKPSVWLNKNARSMEPEQAELRKIVEISFGS